MQKDAEKPKTTRFFFLQNNPGWGHDVSSVTFELNASHLGGGLKDVLVFFLLLPPIQI